MRNASKVFRSGDVETTALRSASIDIREGEFLVIIGPSGSGKSTLLNLIGGMDRPSSGQVFYQDSELSKYTDAQLTLYRRHEVGFVFQFYNLVPTLTALENIEVATEIARNPVPAKEAVRLVGLEKRAGHFPAQMSGGEQQRIAIARALAGNPKLMLCDEPTGALDMKTSRDVLRLLLRLNREMKKTVVVITHNMALAEIGDRVATIRDGEIASLQVNETPADVEHVHW